eukprot:scaffold82051_cov54-Phaeocystis_antarctica.AAC.2
MPQRPGLHSSGAGRGRPPRVVRRWSGGYTTLARARARAGGDNRDGDAGRGGGGGNAARARNRGTRGAAPGGHTATRGAPARGARRGRRRHGARRARDACSAGAAHRATRRRGAAAWAARPALP